MKVKPGLFYVLSSQLEEGKEGHKCCIMSSFGLANMAVALCESKPLFAGMWGSMR